MARRLSLSTVAAMLIVVGCGMTAAADWVHYGGNEWNARHAKLHKITKKNVKNLVPRRVLQLDSPALGLNGSPLVVDGKLYMSAASGWLHATIPWPHRR